MAGIACEIIYTWNGKELSTLSEQEKADARKWMKEHREGIRSIKQIQDVTRLLQPMTYERAASILSCMDTQMDILDFLEETFTLKGGN